MTQSAFEKKLTDLNEDIMDADMSTPSKAITNKSLASSAGVSGKMSPMKVGDASAYMLHSNMPLSNDREAASAASTKSHAASNPSLPFHLISSPLNATTASTTTSTMSTSTASAMTSSPVKIPFSRSQDFSRQEERCPLYIEKASPITSTRERTLNLYQSHQEQAHSLIL